MSDKVKQSVTTSAKAGGMVGVYSALATFVMDLLMSWDLAVLPAEILEDYQLVLIGVLAGGFGYVHRTIMHYWNTK